MEMEGSTRWWPRLVRLMDSNYRVGTYFDCAEGNVVMRPRAAAPEAGVGR